MFVWVVEQCLFNKHERFGTLAKLWYLKHTTMSYPCLFIYALTMLLYNVIMVFNCVCRIAFAVDFIGVAFQVVSHVTCYGASQNQFFPH